MRLRDLIALVTFTLLAAPAIPAASQTVPASSAVISQSPAPPASAPAIPPQQLQMSRIPAIAIRTGDTPAAERARFQREPADILITTPESLYLMLTSNARNALTGVETMIIDEIHSLVPTKRGAHMALSLERLEALTAAARRHCGCVLQIRPVTTGLSAFCHHGQRLLSLGRYLRGCPERLVELVCFPLRGLEDDLGRGIADGVQVNSVLPGPVMTGRRRSYLAHWAPLHNMTVEEATAKFPQEAGIARYGEPEEIAELMAFLVSPAARWMTGSTLRMDGGEVKSI